MEWLEISGSSVLVPRYPIAIIHFLGGAFVGTAPNFTYRWLLEELAKEGYAIIATPFVNTFDHLAITRNVLNRFEGILDRLQTNNSLGQGYLPIYGIGHSMGCKLHLLIGSLFSVERAGNVLISFNNYPVKKAIPFLDKLDIEDYVNLEFTPSPDETKVIIEKDYLVRRNLLIKFTQDNIDETNVLSPILDEKYPNLIAFQTLSGNHLTPLSQDITWEAGEIFTPLDAVGQWVKQNFSRDLYRLKDEVLRWLNPGRII